MVRYLEKGRGVGLEKLALRERREEEEELLVSLAMISSHHRESRRFHSQQELLQAVADAVATAARAKSVILTWK